MQDGALLRPGEEAVHEDGMHHQAAQAAATKPTRPKLTYEMLTVFPLILLNQSQVLPVDCQTRIRAQSWLCVQATTGIPTVFGTFREALHRQRSGRGNPAKDLGLLLDLYEQWQKQVFPHTDFDTFSKKVAGLYGKPGGRQTTGATLKVCTILLCTSKRTVPQTICCCVHAVILNCVQCEKPRNSPWRHSTKYICSHSGSHAL